MRDAILFVMYYIARVNCGYAKVVIKLRGYLMAVNDYAEQEYLASARDEAEAMARAQEEMED